jgi:monofunctional biosynthetic peptidoglycan transglycosylase
LPARLFFLALKLLLAFLLLSVGWVLLYRFIDPPITATMASDLVGGRGATRQWMSLDVIDRDMVRAVVAAEDSKFCAHSGFDWDAISDAARRNASGGRIRGGSTISQQTAKNAFLWPGRDWIRKGLEAGYTVAIETVWGKRRIMEVYLNVAEWAPGVYGAEAAAQHWFGKSAADLSAREAARLAAILPSPRRYDAASPGPYVRRRASRIQAAMGTVRQQGLAACVLG